MKTVAALFFLFFVGCQSAPTEIKEEVGGEIDKNIVLVDTRSALEFNSFHISGSVHLSTADFLLLKNAAGKTRKLDPDLQQTIERLARKGISPLKSVILIAKSADDLENKKWQWLLRKLDVRNLQLISLDEYRKANKTTLRRAEPEREEIWTLKNSRHILQLSDQCFVNWFEAICQK